MSIQPYLNFDGRCEEALEFYKSALGAEIEELRRYRDSPIPNEMVPPGSENKIIHSSFKLGGSTVLASDGHCSNAPNFQGFWLTVQVPTEAEADRIFAALSEGGTVQMAQGETFFSPRFGMVVDRFGVSWMVMVQG